MSQINLLLIMLRPWVLGNVFDNMTQILVLPTISKIYLPERKYIWVWTKALVIGGSFEASDYVTVSLLPFPWIMGKVNGFKELPCKCTQNGFDDLRVKVGYFPLTKKVQQNYGPRFWRWDQVLRFLLDRWEWGEGRLVLTWSFNVFLLSSLLIIIIASVTDFLPPCKLFSIIIAIIFKKYLYAFSFLSLPSLSLSVLHISVLNEISIVSDVKRQ